MRVKEIEDRAISEPWTGYPVKIGGEVFCVRASSHGLAMQVAQSRFPNAKVEPQSLEEMASELNSMEHSFSRHDVEALARQERRNVILFMDIGKSKELSMLDVGISDVGVGKALGGVFVATKYGKDIRYLSDFSPPEAVRAVEEIERNAGRNLSPYDLLDRLVEKNAERRAENARRKENAYEIYGEAGYKAEIRIQQDGFEVDVFSQVYQGVKDVDGVDRGAFVNDKAEGSLGRGLVNVSDVRALLQRHGLELSEPIAHELNEHATRYAIGRARTFSDRETMVTEIVEALKDISSVGHERNDTAGFVHIVGLAQKTLATYQEGFNASGDLRVGAGALALSMIEKYALRLGAVLGSNPEFSAADMRQSYKEGVDTLQILFEQGMSVRGSVVNAVAASVCDSDHGISFSRWQAKDLTLRFAMLADVAIDEMISLDRSIQPHERGNTKLYEPAQAQSRAPNSRSEEIVRDQSWMI